MWQESREVELNNIEFDMYMYMDVLSPDFTSKSQSCTTAPLDALIHMTWA